MENKKKIIGILIGDGAEDTSIINNTFEGLDVAIHDNGKRTFTSGNKFLGRIKTMGFWKQFWIHIVLGGILVGFIVAIGTKLLFDALK